MIEFGIIIEARMLSKRLPGKVLKKIDKFTILEILIKNLETSKNSDKIIVATTLNKKDDKICDLLEKKKISYYRGSENNVFARVLGCAKKNSIKNIIQVTSDQPLIYGSMIDKFIRIFKKNRLEFLTNNYLKSYPIGMYVNIIQTKLLNSIKSKIKSKKEKEHLTYYLMNNFNNFKSKNIIANSNEINKNLRITLDYKEDFKVISFFYKKLKSYKKKDLKSIIGISKKNADILQINSKYLSWAK